MENIMRPAPHRILDVVKETQAEYTFRVAYEGEIRHGQFFQLSIPKVGEAPISVSGKGEGYVEFTIRKIGRLTQGIFGLRPGDVLFMRGPYGTCFPIEEFRGKSLVVICGGTGMAPVKTLLTHFAAHPEEAGQVYLIAGFKNAGSVLFTDTLERFRALEHFHTIYTLDSGSAPGFETGMVTAHIPGIPFGELADYRVAIVGPPPMMHFSAQVCLDCGAAAEKLWVSFERKMSCAVGKCGHCKINETYVCLEGPVFPYTRARELFD